MHYTRNINTEKPTNTQRDLEAIFFFLFFSHLQFLSGMQLFFLSLSRDLQQSAVVNIIKVEMSP